MPGIAKSQVNSIVINPYLVHNFSHATYDSLTAILSNFLNTEDSLFIKQQESYVFNPFWIESDIKHYRTPFFYFNQATNSFSEKYPYSYQPVILSISKEEEYDDYLARIAYVGRWDSVRNYIKQINVVAITRDESGSYKLKYPIEMLTKYWKSYKVGRITYKVNHSRKFNPHQAKKMDSFNTAIAKYFHLPPCSFTYFSCKTYQEMWKTLGVEFNQTMYANDNITGGFTFHYAKRIISGNNSEYYPHELAHIYTNIIYTDGEFSNSGHYNQLLDEGIATYFGGSQEKSFPYIIKLLQTYIKSENKKTIRELFDVSHAEPGMLMLQNEIDIFYAFGAFMAYLVDKKLVYKGLIKILSNTDQNMTIDYVKDIYGVDESNVDEFLFQELFAYK